LQALVPDRPVGGKPEGNWYELVGSSYDRTIYGFEIETSPKQDALLIEKFNRQPNHESYNFVRRNCADFVHEVIDFYYPHALHRSVIGDLGLTTPKQIAKCWRNIAAIIRSYKDRISSCPRCWARFGAATPFTEC
jgi:hypothetical protein